MANPESLGKPMSPISADSVLDALRSVSPSGGAADIVRAGWVGGIRIKDAAVSFVLTLPGTGDSIMAARLQRDCERALARLEGIGGISVVVTTEQTPGPSAPASAPARAAVWRRDPIAHVKRVLAVASGKGGVGKSTTAVNLAHALVDSGQRVGLLDADIHGPSLPRMLGLSGQPEVRGGRILPLFAHGLACISMGLLAPSAGAVAWRGPQVSKALVQMLRGVEWGSEAEPLDVLLIDLPPGTGDIHLSLAQQAPIDGALIVTTPQEVAIADARKALDLFHKVKIPVLGVIENMSGFTDPTGRTHALFGAGGGERLAREEKVPFLGSIPIDPDIGLAADAGARYADPHGYYPALAAKFQ